MIGMQVDQFKIIKSLGARPTGEIFLAENQQNGERYELFAIAPRLFKDPNFKDHLVRDTVKLIKLNHSNLILPTNLLEEEARFFIVTRYYSGQSLSRVIQEYSGRMPREMILKIAHGVLSGLVYAHAQGLIHRILKPDRIVIGQGGQPKIKDFGTVLQRIQEKLLGPAKLAGPALYYAPERFANPDTTDVRANIYAMGAVLFNMSTGRPPFRSKDYDSLKELHARKVVPNPFEINEEIGEDLAAVIVKALQKDPADRFQNANEFLAAIEQLSAPKATSGKGTGAANAGLAVGAGADAGVGGFDFGVPVNDHDQVNMDDTVRGGFSLDAFNDQPQDDSAEAGWQMDFAGETGKQDDDHFGMSDFGDLNDESDANDGFGDVDDTTASGDDAFGDFGGSGMDALSLDPPPGGDDFGFDTGPMSGDVSFDTGPVSESVNLDTGPVPDFAGADGLLSEPRQTEQYGEFDFGEMGSGGIDLNTDASGQPIDSVMGLGAGENQGFDFDSLDKPVEMQVSPPATKTLSEFDFDSLSAGDNTVTTPPPEKPRENKQDLGFDFDIGGGQAGSVGDQAFSFDSPADGSSDFSTGPVQDTGELGGFDFDSMPTDDDSFTGHSGGDPDSMSGFDFGELTAGGEDTGPLDGGGLDDFSSAGNTKPDAGDDLDDFNFGDTPESQNDDPMSALGGGFDFGDLSGSDDHAGHTGPADSGGFDFGDLSDSGGLGGESPAPGDSGGFDFGFSGGPSPTPEPAPASGGNDFGGGLDGSDAFDFGELSQPAPDEPVPHQPDPTPAARKGSDPFGEDLNFDTFADAGEGGPVLPEEAMGPPSGAEDSQDTSERVQFDFDMASDDAGGGPRSSRQDALASDSPLKRGLEESLDAANDLKAPMTAVRVKRFDKKILAVTGGLVIVLLALGAWWFTSSRAKEKQQQTLTRITDLTDARRFNDAIAEIDTALNGASGDFKLSLEERRGTIQNQQKKLKGTIEKLKLQIADYEDKDTILVDGENDLYAASVKLLRLDRKNEEARQRVAEIKEEYQAKADTLLEEKKELEALQVLEALSTGDGSDGAVKGKYMALKKRLVEEQFDVLLDRIQKLLDAKDLQATMPHFQEMETIDPKANLVKDTRKKLINAFVEEAQSLESRKSYEPAAKLFRLAGELDPKNKEIQNALTVLEEDRLRNSIEYTQDRLDASVAAKDLKNQLIHAKKLAELDPGNQYANTVINDVNKAILEMEREGEGFRRLGRYKMAGSVYEEIYRITDEEKYKLLMNQYNSWSPPTGMAFIPSGSFVLGNKHLPDTRPPRNVEISNYFIDKREVTNRQFKAFVDARPEWSKEGIPAKYHDGNYLMHWTNNNGPTPDDLDRPVVFVSWFAARAYAQYHGKRLPSEAEWERAAAGGTEGQKYWWGNYSDAENAVYEFYPPRRTAEVGKFPPNKYDIYEILGNASEWVEDTYDPTYYLKLANAKDPINTTAGPAKVFRGGSFRSQGREVTIYKRFRDDPRRCVIDLGFRCAKDWKGN